MFKWDIHPLIVVKSGFSYVFIDQPLIFGLKNPRFMHYLALFTIPLIPLAFAYMPMFAARNGGFLAMLGTIFLM